MKIAIITARGGSKRIPKKNIREFCGKPIISYSIAAAKESMLFDKVIVSTDSKEIAKIAEAYGAEVPFMRSKATSDDFATTVDVLMEVVSQYGEQGIAFDSITCLYPTAPFVTASKLKDAFEVFQASKADSLMPVVAFSFPPLRGCRIDGGKLSYAWPEYQNTRSQDIPPLYHDSGQFYMVNTSAFMKEKTLMCKNTVPYILRELEVQDIDTEEDWKLAECKYKLFKKPRRQRNQYETKRVPEER